MKGGDHVAVGVERELDAGVTQPLGYDLGMDARLEQEGAVALCALTRRDRGYRVTDVRSDDLGGVPEHHAVVDTEQGLRVATRGLPRRRQVASSWSTEGNRDRLYPARRSPHRDPGPRGSAGGGAGHGAVWCSRPYPPGERLLSSAPNSLPRTGRRETRSGSRWRSTRTPRWSARTSTGEQHYARFCL